MKKHAMNFHKQIEEAFLQQPDIAGIIHGSQRLVMRGAPYRVVSLFTSRKTGGALFLEGELERAAALCLESSDVVSRYVTQAFRVTLSATKYVIPDFLVQRNDGSYLVIEVKPSIRGLSYEKNERYELCRKLLDREGIEYRIIDSNVLPTKYEFLKLNMLYVRGHQQVWSACGIDAAIKILQKCEHQKIQSGRQTLVNEGLPGELCDFLTFHKKMSFVDALNKTVDIAA